MTRISSALTLNSLPKLLPALVDEIAQNNPQRVWSEIPVDGRDLSKGFQDVTFRTFADAVNELCWILESKIGTSTTFATVAYFGPADPSWHIVMIALQKLGFKILCSAPRNSVPMHIHLMEVAECNTILRAPGIDVSHITNERKATVYELPSLLKLLSQTQLARPKHYPYSKVYNDETKMEPLAVLHTSGSTGMPKPIIIRNDYPIRSARQVCLEPWEGKITIEAEFSKPSRRYYAFPPWHAGGLFLFNINISVYGDVVNIFGPSHTLSTGKVLSDIISYGGIDIIFTTPAQVQELYDMSGVEMFKKLKLVGTAGGTFRSSSRNKSADNHAGPLDAEAGNAISKVTALHAMMGSTEAGMLACQYMHFDDWNYHLYRPNMGEHDFRPTGDGRTYELVLTRSKTYDDFAPVFATFPELNEWSSKDLYSKHPTKPNLWRHEARTDDLIVFANAGKLNPLAYEEAVRLNPYVRSSLVIGNQRNAPALLLELHESLPGMLDGITAVLESIWATVEEANRVSPKHGIVKRSHVLLASQEKPFLRASKGTIQRASTLKAYAIEIDAVYKRAESNGTGGTNGAAYLNGTA